MLRFAAIIVASLLMLGLAACGGAGHKSASPTKPATPASTPVGRKTEASPVAPAATGKGTPVPPGSLRLTSRAFNDNGAIPAPYTCDGVDAIPPLTIFGAPASVATFALTVTDIDSPGGDVINWVVWDIPPTSTDAPGGAVPAGGQEALTNHRPPRSFRPRPTSRA